MIPGSNLLNQALTIIAKQSITYYQSTGRSLNNVGQDVTSYAPPQVITGSFQPVPRTLYESLGLDFQKEYFNFYTSNNLIDVGRDVSGDQISFNSQRFQCESAAKWFQIDGWVAILCVLIESSPDNKPVFGFNTVLPHNQNFNFGNGNFSS